MPYSKDWRKYDPILEHIVRRWEKDKRLPMEAKFEEISDAHKFRLKFYAFIKALEKCKKTDEKARELWDIARNMTFRICDLDGGVISFRETWLKPVKVIVQIAGQEFTANDPIKNFAMQVGVLDNPETQNWDHLLKFQEEINAANASKAEVAGSAPPSPPFAEMELKRQPRKPTLVDVSKVEQPHPDEITAADIDAAHKNPFNRKLLDQVARKDVAAAVKIARRQLAAFQSESGFHKDALAWLAQAEEEGLIVKKLT